MPRPLTSNLLLRLLTLLAGLIGTAAGVVGFLAGLEGSLPDALALACIPLSMVSLACFVLAATGGLWSSRTPGVGRGADQWTPLGRR